MKLKELLKHYYNTPNEITMSNQSVVNGVFKELILPGAFGNLKDYRKTLSWNLNRDVYYREATKENDLREKNNTLYVTMTTGKMDFYFTFDEDSEFTELLEAGLKKHRGYRRENLPIDNTRKFLFCSKKYE